MIEKCISFINKHLAPKQLFCSYECIYSDYRVRMLNFIVYMYVYFVSIWYSFYHQKPPFEIPGYVPQHLIIFSV